MVHRLAVLPCLALFIAAAPAAATPITDSATRFELEVPQGACSTAPPIVPAFEACPPSIRAIADPATPSFLESEPHASLLANLNVDSAGAQCSLVVVRKNTENPYVLDVDEIGAYASLVEARVRVSAPAISRVVAGATESLTIHGLQVLRTAFDVYLPPAFPNPRLAHQIHYAIVASGITYFVAFASDLEHRQAVDDLAARLIASVKAQPAVRNKRAEADRLGRRLGEIALYVVAGLVLIFLVYVTRERDTRRRRG